MGYSVIPNLKYYTIITLLSIILKHFFTNIVENYLSSFLVLNQTFFPKPMIIIQNYHELSETIMILLKLDHVRCFTLIAII